MRLYLTTTYQQWEVGYARESGRDEDRENGGHGHILESEPVVDRR